MAVSDSASNSKAAFLGDFKDEDPVRRKRIWLWALAAAILLLAIVGGIVAAVVVTKNKAGGTNADAKEITGEETIVGGSSTFSGGSGTASTRPPSTSLGSNTSPVPTQSPSGKLCDVSIGETCYTDLAQAVSTAPPNSVVIIANNLTVSRSIPVSQAVLAIEGVGSATIISTIDEVNGAIFLLPAQQETTFALRNLVFVHQGGVGSLLRTPHLGDAQDSIVVAYATTHLEITNCIVQKFTTSARGGGAVFLGAGGAVNIVNTAFLENTCTVPPQYSANGTFRWNSGGGAVWIKDQLGPLKIVGSRFENNVHTFAHGSGGAIFIEGHDDVVSTDKNTIFNANKAAGGGALTILDSNGPLELNGIFSNNLATCPDGWDSRGGAAWVQFITKTVLISGSFVGNTATAEPGGKSRGGTVANNIIFTGAQVTLTGFFANNTVTTSENSGAVWDSLSGSGSLRAGAVFKIDPAAIIQPNNGLSNNSPVAKFQTKTGYISVSRADVQGGNGVTLTGTD